MSQTCSATQNDILSNIFVYIWTSVQLSIYISRTCPTTLLITTTAPGAPCTFRFAIACGAFTDAINNNSMRPSASPISITPPRRYEYASNQSSPYRSILHCSIVVPVGVTVFGLPNFSASRQYMRTTWFKLEMIDQSHIDRKHDDRIPHKNEAKQISYHIVVTEADG